MKKCAAFGGGALTEFWFPKRGVGGQRARPPSAPARTYGAFSSSSFAMRWTAIPMPSDLATFKYPCLRKLFPHLSSVVPLASADRASPSAATSRLQT